MPRDTVRPDVREIKRLRSERDWTQKTLAAEAKLSETTVVSIEAGDAVDYSTLVRVAKVLEVGPETLLTDAVSPDKAIAQRLLYFLQDRMVLYEPCEDEHVPYVITSIMEIRQRLREMIDENFQSGIVPILQNLQACCRQFLRNSDKADRHDPSYYKSLRDFRICFADILVGLYKTNLSMQDLVKKIRDSLK